MTALIIIAVFIALLIIIGLLNLSYQKRQSNYVIRKQDDQRKFNPIREKKWWK